MPPPHSAFRRLPLPPRSALPGLFALVLLLTGCGGSGPAPSSATTISVDFAQPVAAKSMVGFLHSMSTYAPMDAYVAPLQPKLWRSGYLTPQIYPRAVGFGSGYILVCSDLWGYDSSRSPDKDFAAYRAATQQIAQQHKGEGFVYDVWNEPDSRLYWSRGQNAYFQTFRVAHDAIRSVDPDALISGPCFYHYDVNALRLFLKFCLQAGVKLDVLTWHELVSGDQIPGIQAHLEEARREFVDNPAFAALGIKRIQINEYTTSDIQYKAASSLAELDRLERGGADAAARACWNDPIDGNNCALNDLDGLLVSGGGQPRAVWWAYKAYAAGVASRVASSSTNSHFVALASSAVPGTASSGPLPQVIVGMYSVPGISRTGMATLTLNHLGAVPALAGAADLRLTIQTIPATDGSALTSLPPAATTRVPVLADAATVTLPVGLEQTYVVSLAPG